MSSSHEGKEKDAAALSPISERRDDTLVAQTAKEIEGVSDNGESGQARDIYSAIMVHVLEYKIVARQEE